MPDFPSFPDLFRIARDEALVRNGKLSLESIERAGTDANILLASASAVGDEVIGQLIRVTASLFLDSATGTDLDRLVFDRYGLTRKPAAAAVGQVEFSTVAPNPSPFVILAGTLLSTVDGIQYSVSFDVLFPMNATSVTANVASILAGFNQQAKPNTITSIVSQISGSPTDLTVNNQFATAGAADAEDDPSLRSRARQFFVTARRGTQAALIQGALAVPGVQTASVFEVLDSLGRPARYVQLIISDAYTVQLATLNTIPPAYATQSQVLASTVFSALSDVRADGIFVQVIVASLVLQPITLHLSFQAGVDIPSVTTQAKAAAVNYVNALSPGQSLIVADLQSAIAITPGLFLTGTEVAIPNGDVIPTPLQVIRTSLEIVKAPPV